MLYFLESISLQLPCLVNCSKHQRASYSNSSAPTDPAWKEDVLMQTKEGLDSAKKMIPFILNDPHSPYKYIIVEIETNIKPVLGILPITENLKSDSEMKFLDDMLIDTLAAFAVDAEKDFTATRAKFSFTY